MNSSLIKNIGFDPPEITFIVILHQSSFGMVLIYSRHNCMTWNQILENSSSLVLNQLSNCIVVLDLKLWF